MTSRKILPGWFARTALVAVLFAFLATALAAPFGRVCLCLTGATPVAVGTCCCDDVAGPLRGETPHSEPSADFPDACCTTQHPGCVDLVAPGDPSAPVERRADILPPLPCIAAAVTPASALNIPWTAVRTTLAHPPDPVASPPPPRLVLRC